MDEAANSKDQSAANNTLDPVSTHDFPVEEIKKLVQSIGDTKLDGRWTIGDFISAGAHGAVFEASDNIHGNSFVVKIEFEKKRSCFDKVTNLEKEYQVLQVLSQVDAESHRFAFPYRLINFNGHHMLVLSKLKVSLRRFVIVADQFSRHIPHGILAKLGIQLLDSLQVLHGHKYVHGDIKPSNIMLSYDFTRPVLIDFGLVTRFVDETGSILPDEKTGLGGGTATYASPNAHRYKRLFPRDDLISLGYMLIELFGDDLDWEDFCFELPRSDHKWILFGDIKTRIPIKTLCGEEVPDEMKDFMNYVMELKWNEEPNYEMLKNLLHPVMNEDDINLKCRYDCSSRNHKCEQ